MLSDECLSLATSLGLAASLQRPCHCFLPRRRCGRSEAKGQRLRALTLEPAANPANAKGVPSSPPNKVFVPGQPELLQEGKSMALSARNGRESRVENIGRTLGGQSDSGRGDCCSKVMAPVPGAGPHTVHTKVNPRRRSPFASVLSHLRRGESRLQNPWPPHGTHCGGHSRTQLVWLRERDRGGNSTYGLTVFERIPLSSPQSANKESNDLELVILDRESVRKSASREALPLLGTRP